MISNLLTSFPPKSTPARTLPSLTPPRKPAVGVNGSLFSFCSPQPKPTPTLPTLSATRRGYVQVRCLSKPDAHRSELWQKAEKGVVFVKSIIKMDEIDMVTTAGGFLVGDEGLVIVAAHSVYQCPTIQVFDVSGLNDRFRVAQKVEVSFFDRFMPSVDAEVVALVLGYDIAVLKLSQLPPDLVFHAFQFSPNLPQVAETINVIGHPDIEYVKKTGYVSSPIRYPCHFKEPIFQRMFGKEAFGFFVTELGVSAGPGFSGSPVFNDEGLVYGCVAGGLIHNVGTIAIPAKFCERAFNYAKNKKEEDSVFVDCDSLMTAEDFSYEAVDAGQRKSRFFSMTQI